MRTITQMLECQRELAKSADRDTEFFDCFRYGSLIPRRHERKMNIGGSYELDGRLLQLSRQSSKLAGDLGRDLHAHEDAHLRDWNNVPTRSLSIDFVRRHIYPDAEFLNEVIVALTGRSLSGGGQ